MNYVWVLLIGLASGAVGAISTGGGLISLPGLIFLGLSPVSAIATTRLGALSSGLASTYRYSKGKKILWRYVPYFMIVAIVAGFIGPRLLFQINEELLEPGIGVVMLLLLPTILHDKKFGLTIRRKSRNKKIAGLAALFVIMIYGTMIGAGGGIFLIYAIMYFFGTNVTQATATGTIMWLAGTIVATITYFHQGVIAFDYGIPLMIGSAIGGSLGAELALEKGVHWVRGILIIVILFASIKLILF